MNIEFTSMALCLADSLIEMVGFDPIDQIKRYLKWYREGYNSSTGECFDIGNQTRSSLEYFESSLESTSLEYTSLESTSLEYINKENIYKIIKERGTSGISLGNGSFSLGNGSLMRLSPIPMYYYPDRDRVKEHAALSSLTTHPGRECLEACSLYSSLIIDAFEGKRKREIMNTLKREIRSSESLGGLGIEESILSGVGCIPSGYAIDSLKCSIRCFIESTSFEESILLAANLGGDSDTIWRAICGQLAGAYYGMSGIPSGWMDILYHRDHIIDRADRLYDKR